MIDYRNLVELDRIHGSLYTDETVFQDEMRRIFRDGWVFVGHESEVPEAGDYITRSLGNEPVILLRNRRGEIRVFSNRCTHRGNMLCHHGRGKIRGAITCSYHGWAFSMDGDLAAVPYPDGFAKEKSEFGLARPTVETYQGFVFATFNPEPVPFFEYLGNGKELIDSAVSMSPVGRLNLSSGWVKHRFMSNWKMLPENDTDGYHANHVHRSFLKTFSSQYDELKTSEEKRVGSVKDWGNGHTAIDVSERYDQPLKWIGASEQKFPDYAEAMRERYGEEKASEIMTAGPPHSFIFPNLFLGEANVVIIQPVSPGESVQLHTPMLVDGAPDAFNRRIIRQSEAAMGPSSFLLADDSVISEQQQLALQGRSGWLEISRGLHREHMDRDVRVGHVSDETTNRGFWRHYVNVMGS